MPARTGSTPRYCWHSISQENCLGQGKWSTLYQTPWTWGENARRGIVSCHGCDVCMCTCINDLL
jgi:hypothetical protein